MVLSSTYVMHQVFPASVKQPLYQVLSNQQLTNDSKWVDKVRVMMSKDHRLTNQNMVIEYNK